MSYQSKTIKHLLCEMIGRNTFLPAIQREYVWSPYQVEKLFDSLLSGYPINTFLFWRIREENKKDWTSYEFIKDFDAESPHNKVANLDGVNQDIYFVLDGQQRITSLNIGLRGSYRFFYRKWRSTRLYLNLLSNTDNSNPEEFKYQFMFKEDASPLPRTDYPQLWYRVGDILNYEDSEDAKEAIDVSHLSDEEKTKALKIIGKLHSVICTREILNFYEEKSNDYDTVLEIFIRTNTGGQKLEYSDILLSTATAKWRNLNAREEINTFTDTINKIGTGYCFGKDFVMKAAMYLTENLPIQYKLSSFTQANLEKIEDHWEDTKEAITSTITLISKFGFTDKNLVTRLALLPIAQYIMLNKPKGFVTATDISNVSIQNAIQKWLILIILKNGLGASSDSKLTQMRKVVADNIGDFPAEALNRELRIDSSFNDSEIDDFLNTNYGTKYSYLILSLLYPGRDWKDRSFNEDHIFPLTEFQWRKLKAKGYDDEKAAQYQACYNSICNLELLDDSENKSKNAKPFDEWIATRDDNFKSRHLIPDMENYDFDHFLEFVEKRRALLIKQIKSVMAE